MILWSSAHKSDESQVVSKVTVYHRSLRGDVGIDFAMGGECVAITMTPECAKAIAKLLTDVIPSIECDPEVVAASNACVIRTRLVTE